MIPQDVPGAEPIPVYEDEAIVVVHKPPFLHSAPLPSGGGANLCEWAFARWPDLAFDPRPAREPLRAKDGEAVPFRESPGRSEGGLFHRLDYGTSGLVLFARSPDFLARLLESQEAGLAEKRYRAFCLRSDEAQAGASPARGAPVGMGHGEWRGFLDGLEAAGGWATGEERSPLEVACRFRSYGPKGARVACLAPDVSMPGGRKGVTEREYRSLVLSLRPGAGPLEPRAGMDLLEVRVSLLRGFRHQVRAQLAWLGLPLLGDTAYGGPPSERLWLMAEALGFPHPASGVPTFLEDPFA